MLKSYTHYTATNTRLLKWQSSGQSEHAQLWWAGSRTCHGRYTWTAFHFMALSLFAGILLKTSLEIGSDFCNYSSSESSSIQESHIKLFKLLFCNADDIYEPLYILQCIIGKKYISIKSVFCCNSVCHAFSVFIFLYTLCLRRTGLRISLKLLKICIRHLLHDVWISNTLL